MLFRSGFGGSMGFLHTPSAFSDINWVEDLTDRRSTIGYCFLLDSSLISWRSKK